MERATARDAANNGRAAFDAGKYEKAIDYLSRAEQLVHAPTHLLYLARAQAKLGRLVAAHETYLKINRETLAPNAPKAFVSAQAAAEQEQDALDARLPSVTVAVRGATSAPETTVQMDGTPLSDAMIGIPLPADPGEHVFKATGPYIISDPITVRLAEAAKQTVTLTLRSNGTAPPAAAATTGGQAGRTAAAGAAAGPAAASASSGSFSAPDAQSRGGDSSSGRSPGLLIASCVSFAAGVASGGFGAAKLLQSSDTRNQSNTVYEDCKLASGGASCTDLDEKAKIDALDNQADHELKLGIVGVVGGGVGLAAGVTFLILWTHSGSSNSASHPTPHVTPVFGLNSLGLAGTF